MKLYKMVSYIAMYIPGKFQLYSLLYIEFITKVSILLAWHSGGRLKMQWFLFKNEMEY